MEFPMPLDWSLNRRPNRPFLDPVFPRQVPHRRAPLPPHRQIARGPTAYYLQQAPFYTANDGPDPYAHVDLVVEPGVLKKFCLVIAAQLATILSFMTLIGSYLWQALKGAAWGSAEVVGFVGKRVWMAIESGKGLEWKTFFLLLVLADRIVRLMLPSLHGRGGGTELELEPVYTLVVRSGRDSMMSGRSVVMN